MSCETNNSSTKSMCKRCNVHNELHFCKIGKTASAPVKKVIPSRKLDPASSNDVKSCSTGIINNLKKIQPSKPRKVTKSDMRFDSRKSVIDFCTKCGDSNSKGNKNGSFKSFNSNTVENLSNDLDTQVFIDQQRRKNRVGGKNKMLREFYKNENFKPSGKENQLNSILDPIKEDMEGRETAKTSSESICGIYSDTVAEIGFLDPQDDKTIRNIKEFRENNYFECHSAKSRVSSKGSAISLTDHKCVFRFYLNERLFPVPLNTDHKQNIRCMDCHLPLESISNLEESETINGTIQAKVKIDNELQDLTLMLPVKKPFIVQERRKLKEDKDKDVLYFGIVKLNYNGNSIFNSTLPNDSLALRYQKGYKEIVDKTRYHYEKIQEDDIIII